MKKILNVLFFCIVIVGITYFFWKKPEVTQKIGNQIKEGIFTEQVPKYSNSMKINSLQMEKADYYYNLLTDEQKSIYDSIAYSIKEFKGTATVKNYKVVSEDNTMSDVASAMDAIFNDHPEIFYISTEYKVSTIQTLTSTDIQVILEYFVSDKTELNDKISEIEKSINQLVSGVDKTDEFKAELTLHDNLAKNVKYYVYKKEDEIPKETHSIYGVFVSKTGVCDGFTKAMQILLDKVGIESILVSGTLQGQSHAWNMVKINGNWYNMDLTSDKSLDKYTTNLVLTIHSYFNITTEKLKKSHTINKENLIPQAKDTTENYYIKTGRYIYNTDNFSNRLKEIFNVDLGDNILEFETNNTSIALNKMSEVLQDNKYNEYKSKNNTFKYYNILDTYIITKY